MEYCSLVWAVAPNYQDILDKLQKQVCRGVGVVLVASIEPIALLSTYGQSTYLF